MENVSVISYTESPCKISRQFRAGREVTYIYTPKSRRRLRRMLLSCGAKRAAILGDAPEFVKDVLKKAEIEICTGEKLMENIYPQLISRAAKMNKQCTSCTVYDENADGITLEIIKCASSFFRHVSLCTSSENIVRISDEIMDTTGLALGTGETGGVGIIRSGSGGRQAVKVDLTERSRAVFTDENHNLIMPSLAEALAGDHMDEHVLKRLNLKIHPLC